METIQEKELYLLFSTIALLANSDEEEGRKITQEFNKISKEFKLVDVDE